MNKTVKLYQAEIPPITVDHPLWILSLGHITRYYPNYWNKNAKIKRLERDFDFKDKIVCVLGSGIGLLGHIADIYGAKKIIGVEKKFWAVVYTRGLYPKWDIRWGNYYADSLPEADIYLYADSLLTEGNDFIDEFYQKHQRAFMELERIYKDNGVPTEVKSSFNLHG